MAFRRWNVANVETLSDVETWEHQLPRAGVLNGFLLQLRGTNGATSNIDASLAQCVTKIQVRDGSKCFMDLTGEQAAMVSLLNAGAPLRSDVSEGADDVQTYQALLQFGEKLYDERYALDLRQLNNPQIRVEFDLTAVRAAGATGFVTGSGRISCVVFVNDGDDVPVPEGYIKSTEIKQWTTAASGDETTQAPMDGPWRRLIARAHVAGSNPDAVLTDVKVSFDSGKFVAIDELTKWAADGFAAFNGVLPMFSHTVFKADTETHDLRHGGVVACKAQALTDTNVACVAGFEDGEVTINLNVLGAGTTQGTEDDIYLEAWVTCPFMCMVWDFVGQGMLDVGKYTRGDITFTQGTASAAASLVLQQLMSIEAT